jgi:hypothetical protein
VIDYLFDDGHPKKRQLTAGESDDDDDDDDDDGDGYDDSSPSIQNASHKRRIIRSDDVLKIVDGAPLQLSMSKSTDIEHVRKIANSRVNFTLREVVDPKKRELWKRCYEVIILDHIQRGPVEDIPDSENDIIESMIRDIRKHYYQMFGDDSPELTEEQLRAVIYLISLDLC